VASYERLWFGKSITRARSFLPISDDSDRDYDASRLNQTRCGNNNLLPHPFEEINLRGYLACDMTTDTQDIHGPTSLLRLINHKLGIMPAIASAYGQKQSYRERSCSQILVSLRLQARQVLSMSTNQSQLATAALETLHGARALPPAEAVAKLRDFVDSIGTILPPTARLADASGALRTLVNQLETEGAATDDTWEYAIETMLSFANESA
jgi:hypothetical protein